MDEDLKSTLAGVTPTDPPPVTQAEPAEDADLSPDPVSGNPDSNESDADNVEGRAVKNIVGEVTRKVTKELGDKFESILAQQTKMFQNLQQRPEPATTAGDPTRRATSDFTNEQLQQMMANPEADVSQKAMINTELERRSDEKIQSAIQKDRQTQTAVEEQRKAAQDAVDE